MIFEIIDKKESELIDYVIGDYYDCGYNVNTTIIEIDEEIAMDQS